MSIEITESNGGFQWINHQLATITQGKDRDHIGCREKRIFNKIKDWFYGTQREEVKKCLYDLLSPDTNDAKKYLAFKSLSAMVSDAHKDKFSQEISSTAKDKITLRIELEDSLIEIDIHDKSSLILEHEILKESITPTQHASFQEFFSEQTSRKKIIIEGEIEPITKNQNIINIQKKCKYTFEQYNALINIFHNSTWLSFCHTFNLPIIAWKILPESICMEVKKEKSDNFKVSCSLAINNGKKFNEIDNIYDYINISNERSLYL